MGEMGNVRLDVILARGQVSPSEIQGLGPGSRLVFFDRSAGEPATLLANGRPMALVEVGGRDGRFTFRLFDGDWSPRSLPGRVGGEGLLDRLPVELKLWGGPADAEILGRLAPGAVLEAAKATEPEVSAELLAFGEPLAVGVPIISGELWGLEIRQVVKKGWSRGGSSGAFLSEAKSKVYDFSRPDRFSREQVVAMCGLHQDISAAIGPYLPSQETPQVTKVDQLAWFEIEEYIGSGVPLLQLSVGERQIVGGPGDSDLVFHLDLDTGRSDDESAARARAQAQRSSKTLPLERVYVAWEGDARDFPSETFAALWQKTWRTVYPVSLQSPTTWTRTEDLRSVEAGDMILLVEMLFEGKKLSVIYPYLALRKILGLITGSGR